MYPKNMGDKQIFREDFHTEATVFANGGAKYGAPSVDGGLDSTSGGYGYLDSIIKQFFETGGTLRIRFNLDSGVTATYGRMFIWGEDSSNGIALMVRQSDGDFACSIVKGGTSTTAKCDVNFTAGVDYEFTLVWDPDTPAITSYLDGTVESSATTSVAVSDTSGIVHVGHNGAGAGTFLGTIYSVEISSEQWSAEEVLDAYEKDTYQELDVANDLVYLPFLSEYNDGSNVVTRNLGTEANAILRTSTSKPTKLDGQNGYSFDGGDEMIVEAVTVSSTKDFTIFLPLSFTDTATAATHFVFRFGADSAYTSDGLLFNQFGASLLFYWNSGSASVNVSALTDGVHSVAISSDGGQVDTYVDGLLLDSTDLSAKAALDGDYQVELGNTSSSGHEGNYYGGLRFRSSPSTPKQIRWLHNRFIKNFNK